MPALNDAEVEALKVWVRDGLDAPGLQRAETVMLKNGPQVFKTASLLSFGKSPEQITKIEFRVQTSKRDLTGGFVKDRAWACDGDEVGALTAFLTSEFDSAGDYWLAKAGEGTGAVLAAIKAKGPGFLQALASVISDEDDGPEAISEVEGIEVIGTALDLVHQRQGASQLAEVVGDPDADEASLQRVLDENWWLLGSNYVAKLERKQFTVLDKLDLALLRADNVLHIVELKRANIPRLVLKHRNHYRVGDDINEAVNQAANYLVAFDEQRDRIRSDFGIDCRRAQATVVIGHPRYNDEDDVGETHVRDAIRVYNSHLSRIEVITYEDVLATATASISALQTGVARAVASGPEVRVAYKRKAPAPAELPTAESDWS